MGDHGHSHRAGRDADLRYLAVALALIGAFLVVELVAGLLAGSLALLADAGHMLTDAGALAASIWAIRLAARPATDRHSYGLDRAEILSAAVNGVTLLVVSALVAAESVRRLVHPPPVAGAALLVVAGAGLAVNAAAAAALARADRAALNVQGAFVHVLTDAYAFAATLLAGLLIVTTGYRRADPLASLVVVALMLRAAWGLLRASGRILLEAVPEGVDLAEVRAHLLQVEHVRAVHDLHAWVVTSDLPALSAHLVIDDDCFLDGHAPQLLDQVQSCLTGHFDVEHSTLQFEPAGHSGHELGAH